MWTTEFELLYIPKDMEDNIKYPFELAEDSKLSINGVQFGDGIVTKVSFEKYKTYDGKIKTFMYVYMGNIKIGAVISDVGLVIRKDKTNYNATYYYVSEVTEYDLKKNKPLAEGSLKK